MTTLAPSITIRPATASDIDQIHAIYADSAYNGVGTFAEEPPALGDMLATMNNIQSSGWPYLVAELPIPAHNEGHGSGEASGSGGSSTVTSSTEVVGFAYVSQFRPRSAYRFCCEDSIYLAPSAKGKGIASALLERLITEAKAAGFLTILAVIGGSENKGSIGLHAKFGFKHVGVMKDVGLKLGKWLDVVIMQLDIPGMEEKKTALVAR